jgi:hypothetical protein
MSYDEEEEKEQRLGGRTPAQIRAETLRERLVPWARECFARFPEVRSILLGVSQYWADEANDAVHADSVFATTETPHWPHLHYMEWDNLGPRPDGYHDFCSSCGQREERAYPPWSDSWDAIPGFEMFCHEEGSQESDDNFNAMPFALLRRASDGDVDVEIVGRVLRGWLDRADEWVTPVMHDERLAALYHQVYAHLDDDGPRHVLADELLQRGEPLGEYLSLVLAREPTRDMRARADALLATHQRAWMGGLWRVVPVAACHFARGFPTRVAAHYDELALNESWSTEAWRTVEALHLLPGCWKGGLPEAPGLRELGPLGNEQLLHLAGQPVPRLARLELDLDRDDTIENLQLVELPSLRALILGGRQLSLRALAIVARMRPGLDTIELRTREAATITAWLEARARVRRLSFCGATYAGWASGFRLTHDAADGDALHVELVALDRDADATHLGELIAQLPLKLTARVLLHGSRLWTPLPHELEQLRKLTRRSVAVV